LLQVPLGHKLYRQILCDWVVECLNAFTQSLVYEEVAGGGGIMFDTTSKINLNAVGSMTNTEMDGFGSMLWADVLDWAEGEPLVSPADYDHEMRHVGATSCSSHTSLPASLTTSRRNLDHLVSLAAMLRTAGTWAVASSRQRPTGQAIPSSCFSCPVGTSTTRGSGSMEPWHPGREWLTGPLPCTTTVSAAPGLPCGLWLLWPLPMPSLVSASKSSPACPPCVCEQFLANGRELRPHPAPCHLGRGPRAALCMMP
jgi:hypothetical protein